ncbi:hypothetical protein [Desulfomonile tiedjei]|uniref:Uncharacterized protein n=1 Tax=Desulfomonile tiedjei (strain ATCC 49306 / DSM 6799 / DCB-1) TaxID=706587 RepID=I4C9M2_DESTA|nr:hypothetical protein [Desulfomonile tiedjei]AFM26263.1 hypothetical protein Desti_3615 [Desulfomonile tiedjei DSM 6799]
MAGAFAEFADELLPIEGFRASWDKRIDTASPESTQKRETRTIRVRTAENLSYALPDQYKVPAFQFRRDGLNLRALKPVTIKLARGENLWFAENERLDIYATGDTPQEAIEEFVIQLLSFYEHYRDLNEAQARGGAKRLKNVFATAFEVMDESRS